jgi:RNA polymerase sigma-70 factor (ECF subfamily)
MGDVTSPDGSAKLVDRWRAGDQAAATALWERYAVRLLALVRKRLSGKLAQHIDPEDVVQSAYRCFFASARAGRYLLHHSGDLWRLLVAITLHRLHHHTRHQRAGKRAVALEQSFGQERELSRLQIHKLARGPSHEDAVALADELQRVLKRLVPLQRRMVEMRLQGYSLDEIGAATERNERTVRRVLKMVERHLKQRCAEYSC